jgi:hypothetical protein
MANQVRPLEELLAAIVALVLLDAQVPVLMRLQVGPGAKAAAAQVADMRLFLGVHAHVRLQCAGYKIQA